MPAEFLEDFADFARGDALDTHLGRSKQESLFAARSFFRSAGVKFHAVANLGDARMDGADTGGKGLGLEAIGAAPRQKS